ncbi:MAG: hypothetical protein FJY85_08980 [Deltaproteobacteria bacterium]|nr:hypothetical protein [Deltaproteobacteria bacterium]
MRSTGLGKTELVAEIKDCRPQGDHLILLVNTTDPVKWKVRCTMTFKDLRRLIIVSLKISILKFILSPSRWFREPEHPGDF